VSGIWPPDVGGPASHAPQVADELIARGHDVEVATTAASAPEARPYPVHHISRSLPPGVRHVAAAALVAQLSRRADVVYKTSMIGRTSFTTRVPHVVKIAGDIAFERARRRGLYSGSFEEFQRARLDPRGRALRRWRTATVRRASHVFCPSEFLRDIVVSWGIAPERVSVLPNPTPPLPNLPPRDQLRKSFGINGPTLAFAGRFTRAKAPEILRDAIAQVDDVTLLAAGDGEERDLLRHERITLLGPLERERVLELFGAADAAVLSSSWETFSHMLVEALAAGTPVIATRTGGVPEIVEHGVNGLLVPPGDAEALAAAIRRFFGDAELRARLRSAAAPSVARFAPAAVFDTLEETLLRARRNYS
jgi:glycosyltransferase involved in cell wall biosynthesis